MIAAIPTRYKGVQMRSRLEARWAAFFDLMRWPWHYEPIDLQGWIPDFILGEDLQFGLLVEVKPIEFPKGDLGTFLPEFGAEAAEIERARSNVGAHHGLLVCGLRPRECVSADRIHFGWMFGMLWCSERRSWKGAIAYRDKRTGVFDTPIGTDGWYPGAITRENYDAHQEHIDFFCGAKQMLDAWHEAGNRVQWRAPR